MFHWFFKLADGCALTPILFIKKSLKKDFNQDSHNTFKPFTGFQKYWEIFISQNLKTVIFLVA